MRNIFLKILDLVDYITRSLRHFINKQMEEDIKLISREYDSKGRFRIYTLSNNNLLDHKKFLKLMFNYLMNSKDFLNFGYNKVIIVRAKMNDTFTFSFHHNILINNNTTFNDYYDMVKDIIINHYNKGPEYNDNIIPIFEILVWNVDSFKNSHIKLTKDARIHNKSKLFASNGVINNISNTTDNIRKYHTSVALRSMQSLLSHQTLLSPHNNATNHYNSITPINKTSIIISPDSIAAMDIETMEYDNKQIPMAISLVFENVKKLFLIETPLNLDNTCINNSVNNLWNDFFVYLIENKYLFKTIFIHNLGSFDGYFIYKAISNYFKPNNISTIIDDKNKFIQISLTLGDHKIFWKDSYRIFPVSLQELANIFNVEGKFSKYNIEFNSLELFKENNHELLNKFKQYSLQDSITLFKALIEAQILYISLYNIDITSILSTSTLSLKNFRQNFLEVDIPILKGSEDNFIRNSYFGGATDYYKAYIKNGYYYDVNSLYPFAMLKPMPHKIIKYYKDLSNIKLENFFGFCLAEITTPKQNLKPLLPYKHKGKTIFPTGSFIGVYFSEELKAVQSRGYQITLISGYEYSQISLFTKYVEHFYNKKKNSFGAERFIAKMHLNQLYGIFGRKKDLIQTINIYKKDLPKYITTKIIKTIININNDIVAILIQNNINVNIIKSLNIFFDKQFISNFTEVKNNVAIASAVTAYSRIHIMTFKENSAVAYTDTDSIFTTDKLPNNLIGKDIGLMKDELEGNIIQEAYFLDGAATKNMAIGIKILLLIKLLKRLYLQVLLEIVYHLMKLEIYLTVK